MSLEVFNQSSTFVGYDPKKATEILNQKLKPEWIEQRKQGGATLSYIGGHIVIRLLNNAFNYQWSFEIIHEEIVQSLPKAAFVGYGQNKKPKVDANGNQVFDPQPPVVKVRGRLTVPGLGVKEQYGSKVLIGGATEQESAFKSASTDALKKCASLFGIGLELYGEAEGLEYQAHEKYIDAPAPETAAVVTPVKKAAPQVKKQEPVQEEQPINDDTPVQEQFQTAAQAVANNDIPKQQETVLTPNPQEEEKKEQKAAASQFEWPPAEVTRLIGFKKDLQITSNDMLNPYVQAFMDSPDVTFQNITPANITAFNAYLEKQL